MKGRTGGQEITKQNLEKGKRRRRFIFFIQFSLVCLIEIWRPRIHRDPEEKKMTRRMRLSLGHDRTWHRSKQIFQMTGIDRSILTVINSWLAWIIDSGEKKVYPLPFRG